MGGGCMSVGAWEHEGGSMHGGGCMRVGVGFIFDFGVQTV